MREKELRLALVCYGGVSLAVYMHGITKEIWKLLRASSARATDGNAPGGTVDTEAVYGDLLAALAPQLELHVLADIVAGASAGGINGIFLAHAVVGGHDMEPLRDLWLSGADVDRLLEPLGAARRFSKWWATPLIRWAGRRGIGIDSSIADPAVRAEVRAKLSRVMRSRWFRPPFSGAAFTGMLYDALAAMEAGIRGPPLIPPTQPLDLFVTVTDYHGAPEHLHLHSPRDIVETEHRLVIAFNSPGADAACERSLGDRAELSFAARATSSFPGAFPPTRIVEVDDVVAARGTRWPGRAAFLARLFPGRARYDEVTLIDGSVLNNRPFGPAIEALRHRPAHREVDRRFVYIDPKPGLYRETVSRSALPGWFATVLRSLADIPREQPIRDNLTAITVLSARIRRLRFVVDGMATQVDAAIERAVGPRFFLFKLTPARLSDWRSRTNGVAAKEAGFAYAAYAQLKLSHVVESIAASLAQVDDRDRAGVWAAVRAAGVDATRGGAGSAYVMFLRSFDLGFRIRRLRFLIRRVNALAVGIEAPAQRRAVEDVKAELYQILAPYLERRRAGFYLPADAAPEAALAGLGAALDLRALDEANDARLTATIADIPAGLRRVMLRAYLGFPFYDIAMLPLLEGDGIDEFDEILVDRISPDDAVAIRRGGARATLKGIQFNAFGAFFSRAYRENDYLWGRLHGADRLIDIVVSTLPPGAAFDAAPFKLRAFRAILDAERPFLTAIPELFDDLEDELSRLPGSAS